MEKHIKPDKLSWPALALTLLLGGRLAPCLAAGTINWGWFESAPYMIVDGPDKNHGMFDQVRALLARQLPDYDHHVQQAPFPRVFHEIENGNNWCFVGGTESAERDRVAYFSLPVIINLPHKIIVLKQHRDRFGAGPQSLEKLLTTPGLRTSVLRERAINPAVDALLRKYPPTQHHSDFGESIQMLQADRLDYLIETMAVADYYALHHGQRDALVGMDIKEYDQPSYFRVMCPKTPWGRQVIADVNQVLRRERPTPAYRDIIEYWSNKGSLRRIRGIYEGAFLTTE